MQPGYVVVEEAKPGDRIKSSIPHGDAVVVTSSPSMCSYTQPRGAPQKNDGSDALAWIVVFDITSGAHKGTRHHSFQHPKDRIARA